MIQSNWLFVLTRRFEVYKASKLIFLLALGFLCACAKKSAPVVTENDLKLKTMYVTNWSSEEPSLTADLSTPNQITWTEPYGTKCQLQISQSGNTLTLSNPVMINDSFHLGDIEVGGQPSCDWATGTYTYTYEPGVLTLCQIAPITLSCVEYK